MDRETETEAKDDVPQEDLTEKKHSIPSEAELEDLQGNKDTQTVDLDTTVDQTIPSPETNTSEESVNEAPAKEIAVLDQESSSTIDETESKKQDIAPEPNNNVEEDAQLAKQRVVITELETAVKREVNARKVRKNTSFEVLVGCELQELEDMLMRMEQHLKTEEKARKHSEKMLDESLKNEVGLKKELDSIYSHQKHLETSMAEQKLTLESEKESLEAVRQQMEEDISTAKDEAKHAIEALKTAEDRVRASERTEMAKMESEYQKRISMLAFELERVRQELVIRTKILTEEMERWRQQAEYTSAAVIEAKAEVSERKRDLDATRDKMDKLMDRLHVGREQGLVLQASLTAANAYTSHAQRTLINSMDTSLQQNVQQSLPWGGQIGEKTGGLLSTQVTGVEDLTMFKRAVDVVGGSTRIQNTKPKLIDEQSKTTGRRKRR